MGEAKRRMLMAEEILKNGNEALNEVDLKVLAVLEIVMLPNGEIRVKGPINNKPLCKALLAGAEELINAFQRQVIPVKGFPGKMPMMG